MRRRAGVVILVANKVAVIKRVKSIDTYYVVPGGQMEVGETIEEAAIREAKEELGVDVELVEKLVDIEYNGMQYYFSARIVGGEFGQGTGEEFTKGEEHGSYEAVWLDIEQVDAVDFRPIEIVSYIKNRLLN